MTAEPTNAETSATTTACRDKRPTMPTGNRLELSALLKSVDAALRQSGFVKINGRYLSADDADRGAR